MKNPLLFAEERQSKIFLLPIASYDCISTQGKKEDVSLKDNEVPAFIEKKLNPLNKKLIILF